MEEEEEFENFLIENDIILETKYGKLVLTLPKNMTLVELAKILSSEKKKEVPEKKKEVLPKNTFRVNFTKISKNKATNILDIPNRTKDQINKLRKQIHKNLKEEFDIDDYPTINAEMIAFLINEYDNLFFENLLSYQLNDNNLGMLAIASNLLTSSAGCETREKDDLVIKISTKIINNITPDNVHRLFANKDTHIEDQIDGLMEIVEHELIHALNVLDPESNKVNSNLECELATSHNNWFKTYVNKLFLHTKIRHNLIDVPEKANMEVIPKDKVKVGMTVSFIQNGTKYTGTIIKLNPVKTKVNIGGGGIWNVPYSNLLYP